MEHLNIDLETYSSVDITSSGLYKYVQSPDFEVLLFGYSRNGAPPVVIDLAAGESIPADIVSLLFSRDCRLHAYNAAFEWYCLSQHFGLDHAARLRWISGWEDTMLHALYCGYPAKLEAACIALGLPEDKTKLSTGKALIRYFCVPCKGTKTNHGRTRNLPQHDPDKWALFKQYNAKDVVAEQEVERRLSPWPIPPDVYLQWVTDLKINLRGVAVDTELVFGAIACSKDVEQRMTEEGRRLTGLSNPNSNAQLMGWLLKRGAALPDLRKETVDLALQQEITNPAVRRMLEVRQELSKTSVKKYNAMAAAVCLDGRVRGTLQFYGANRTGRWSGRIIQPQNLPRTHLSAIVLARELVKSEKIDTLQLIYGSVPNTLSQLARTALIASPGKAFVDADFAAIEARVIAWLAGEEWVLEVFRTHGKIYEATASQMFGVPLEKIVKGEPEYELRQRGKVATLALGYQGGANALTTMDTAHAIPDDDKPALVRLWRDANPAIVSFWYDVEDAAVSTLQDGNPRTVRGIGFSLEGHSEDEMLFLAIRLPSGRSLLYPQPFLASNRFGKPSLHFMGSDQTTKKWGVQETYGGKLVENITQAVARDCLAQAIENLEAAGYPVVFHVHDEVICEVMPGTALDAVIQVMAQPIFWAPGLPLAADGWVGAFYTKD